MSNKKKQFRWKYFIDKPFQLRFIVRFFVLILIGLGVSFAAIGISNLNRFKAPLYFKAKLLDPNAPAPTDPNQALLNSIDFAHPMNSFELYWPPLVLVSILYLVLIAVFGLFISHKMAGPVYRIKKTLEEASNGKVDLKSLIFKLRKKDELQDLVDSLNKFLEKTYRK